jgi:hypothetical protein
MTDAPKLLRVIARPLAGLAPQAQAAALFGARARTDGPRSTWPLEDATSAAAHAACRAALGEVLFDIHSQAGAVLPIERAVRQA